MLRTDTKESPTTHRLRISRVANAMLSVGVGCFGAFERVVRSVDEESNVASLDARWIVLLKPWRELFGERFSSPVSSDLVPKDSADLLLYDTFAKSLHSDSEACEGWGRIR